MVAVGGDESAAVTWSAPPNGGSTIISYTVTPFIGAVAQTPTVVNGTPPVTNTTVTGLTNGTTYTFRVTATNLTGTGAESAASNPVTPAPPTAPSAPTGVNAVAGNASATVSWTAPANGGSVITSYTVTPYIGAVAQTATVVNGTPPVTNATVTGLTNGTTYTFTVTAANAVGAGPESAASTPVTPTPPPTVPDAPSGVTAVAGDTSATVTWTAPANGGSVITSYTVTPYIGAVAQTATVVTGTPPVTNATVTGLTNGTTYTFTVTAANAVGTGPESAASGAITPVGPPPLQISGGASHSCALITGGTVKCWGIGEWGQLGNGTFTPVSYAAVSVVGITDAVQISAGANHTCALLAGGTVKCWGANSALELGIASSLNQSVPVTSAGITDAIQISSYGGHTCALILGGTVRCWGANSEGQLGDGTTLSRFAGVTVTGLTDATEVTTGGAHTCALVVGGTVKCWGYNTEGQLGNGTFVDSTTPVPVTGLTDASRISAVAGHTCALITGGAAKCWGNNTEGQLGRGSALTVPPYGYATPQTVVGLTGALDLAGSCALLSGGSMKCWGSNTFGQVGDGTFVLKITPVSVLGVSDAVQISTGARTCAITVSGSAKCWGHNPHGQLGTGTATLLPPYGIPTPQDVVIL